MKKINVLETGLKNNGLKNTKHRSAILDILVQSDQPIAVEQIFYDLKERNVSISLSTVYRTLETLTDKNMVTKISIIGDNRALFEYNKMIHRHYLVCTGCKKIVDIKNCPLEAYEKSLEQETNFKISGHKLNIYGFCPQCQKIDIQEEVR